MFESIVENYLLEKFFNQFCLFVCIFSAPGKVSKKQVTKTGGGGLPKITPAEQIYLDSLDGTPKLIGIAGIAEVGI